MARIKMYTSTYCPYCRAAERLLASKGITEIEKISVDREPEQRDDMMRITGQRTVPQIFIGDTHVGGYDDLAALNHAGELDPLLAT